MSIERDDPRVLIVEDVLMKDLLARARQGASEAPTVTDMAVHVVAALDNEQGPGE